MPINLARDEGDIHHPHIFFTKKSHKNFKNRNFFLPIIA
jgi:hypothetical protein